MYNALVDYLENLLSNDTEFDKLLMKFMIKSNNVSGAQVIHILYEQEVLDKDSDEDYADFISGKLSDYKFIRRKINNLEITPAQLALDHLTEDSQDNLQEHYTLPGNHNNHWSIQMKKYQ